MSHITDFTSLSDLLHTSPLPSSSTANGENPGPSLNLAASNIQQENQQEQEEQVSNSTVELIKLQGSKIELIESRDSLVKQRSELNSQVEDLRLRLRMLKERQASLANEKRMNELLSENSSEYHRSINTNNQQQQDFILNILNVYPSSDWDKRLDQLRMFNPYLELESLDTSNYYDETNHMIRMVQFTVVSPLLFKIPLRLDIECARDSVVKIEVGKLPTPPMLTISLLSPSLANVLIKNYIPNNKINLIMYGVNSLSKLVHKRISTMYKLIRKFKDLINDRIILQDLLTEQECDDNLKLFAIMKSLDRVQFNINNQFKVIMTWKIVLRDTITATCESQINIYITDWQNQHNSKFKSADELFQKLIEKYGINNALEIVFKNICDYNIDAI
ncbi:hypothetical protein JA1_000757 [Spathaspora sp. JA1]|nr:hypothetical protein JA1_000757 [Spathaspora sp. JA1]